VYRYVPEAAARVAALETGQFDILFATPVQDYQRLNATGDFDFHTPPQYGGSLTYLGSNKMRPMFQDVQVRQALNYALDKESIVRVVFPINGQVAYGNLPPHFSSAYPDAESIGYHYDPEQARQLLEEAGWVVGAGNVREKDGQRMDLNFMIITSQEATATAQIVQANLREVGIEATITQTDSWAALQPTLLEGDYDLWLGGYGWGSPTILDFWFGAESASNVDHLDDPTVYALLAETGQASTIEERDAKYQELDRHLTEQAIWAPIVFVNDLVAVNKRVRGYRFTPAGEQSFATDWSLAE
jgi:peptide/nickel transport system substrate-binding protein